jgi:hypothetical protein
VELDVHPEPSAEHRAALRAALENLGAGDVDGGRSAWWRLGVEESLEAIEE